MLHNALESEPDAYVLTWVYFVLVTLMTNLIVLSLFVAVVVNTFQEVRSGHEREAEEHRAEAEGHAGAAEAEGPPAAAPKASLLGEEEQDMDGDTVLELWAKSYLSDSRFRHAVSLTIVAHVTAMSLDVASTPEQTRAALVYVYYAANCVFACEVLLRFAASGGSKAFFQDNFHLLEISLVVCGLIGSFARLQTLVVLPSVRLLRLCSYVPTLKDLLDDCLQSQRAFLNLLLFMSLVGLCFAVTGRYIFRGNMGSFGGSNFDSLDQAILTIFQLFTGDQWR